ncbi:hypothetical protein EMPG_15345 [Blastomyces silverae]|uniref:Uncharacterized protein n=1 Tax=Blastomyces silverae TaxID=2060906 RepID=A0A0H1BDV5_9EURO|nr:hypothetical protein EMPG_15345 [Blastomyces silverae]
MVTVFRLHFQPNDGWQFRGFFPICRTGIPALSPGRLRRTHRLRLPYGLRRRHPRYQPGPQRIQRPAPGSQHQPRSAPERRQQTSRNPHQGRIHRRPCPEFQMAHKPLAEGPQG